MICYNKLGDLRKSDSLIAVGFSDLKTLPGFDLERSYFLKSLGISYYEKGDYLKGINNLKNALPELVKINDINWICITNFYLRKCYEKINQKEIAIKYFQNVDLILLNNNLMIPELRANFESLINYYHKKDTEKELYFTKRLIQADDILKKDFVNLSDKIYKEYDTKSLQNRKEYLESKNVYATIIFVIFLILIVILLVVIRIRRLKEKEIQKKYEDLLKRNSDEKSYNEKEIDSVINISKEVKISVQKNIVDDILTKLVDFERKRGYTKKGLTQQELAKSFNTNTTYLSQVIKEFKGKKFNTYINELRILYITKELFQNQKFLDYTIEGLAEKCGMTSRQNFSDLFFEINGIRPTDFIRQRRKELHENEKIALLN